MKHVNPDSLSALLDGELTGWRHWFVQRHVQGCPLCSAEYRQLNHVRQMLAANPVQPGMSDAPEFFWSKVKREIQALGHKTVAIPTPRLTLLDWLGQHQAALVGVAAALVVMCGIVLALPRTRPTPVVAHLPAVIDHVATALPDSVATPLKSDNDDVAVIWVSGLPWTKDMHAMQTLYASPDI